MANSKKKTDKDLSASPVSIRTGWILLTAILIIASLVYIPSLDNNILNGWDDGVYLEDEHVKDPDGKSISHFFNEYYLGMYQPLAVLSLSTDHQLYEDKSSGYHATNLVLHLLNIVLAFFFINILSKKRNLALIVALLFAIHPMHVEAVSWIAARSTLLFSAFYLSALIFYLRYLERESWSKLSITFLFFLLACFTKSMAVTLPLVLVLLDYFHGRKLSSRLIIEKLPFLALSIVFGIVTVNAAGSYGHIENLSSSYHFLDRIFLFTYGIAFYLYKLIIPVKLSAIYSYPMKVGGLLPVVYYLSPLMIILMVIVTVYFKKFRKEVVFGVLFFFFTISLVLPLYWSRLFIVAERYSYLTYIGIYFIIALGISGLFDKQNYRLRKYRSYGIVLLAGALLFYLITSIQRSKDWKDTGVLLTDVIEKPHDQATHAYAHYYRANYRDMAMDFKNALSDYDRAIQLNPGFILAYNNRGIVKGMGKDFTGALEDFTTALELKPDYADAWYNRGLAQFQLGNVEAACQDWGKADELGSLSASQFIRQHCGR
jgi:tetratricopeptide (TPR) repeat protein